MHCKINNSLADFLYIDYDDLILNPEKNVKRVYDFCDIKYFNHYYNNIELKYPENSEIIFKNMVDVRPKIKKRTIELELSKKSLEKIKKIEELFEKIKIDHNNEKTINEFKKFYMSNVRNSSFLN